VNEHLHDAEPSMQDRNCREHEAPCAEICARDNDRDETLQTEGKMLAIVSEVEGFYPRTQGNIRAPIMRINPGAFSWYHGAVLVLRDAAHANAKIAPAMTELKNILSIRILALLTPAREHCSVASFGE
jgi:hypothetical protein